MGIRELEKEVKDLQVILNEHKEQLFKKRNRTVTETLKFKFRYKALKASKAPRNFVTGELDMMAGLYNAIAVEGAGYSSSVHRHAIF